VTVKDAGALAEQWKGPEYADSKPAGFIFTGATGTVLHPRRADAYFAEVRSRAGMDSHRFHSLRHDFASLLLAASIADRAVWR
jgi:site-specific recombinase XerC